MVAVGQDQSLFGVEGNYRGQVTCQLGIVAHPVGSRWAAGSTGLLASRSAMRTRVMVPPW
jgi:hypothetical protein